MASHMRRTTRVSTSFSSLDRGSSRSDPACTVGRIAVWPATFLSFTVSSRRGSAGLSFEVMKPSMRRWSWVSWRSVSRSSWVMYCESVRGYVVSFFSYNDCNAVRVRAAVRPCSRAMSFCRPVRSYRRGGLSCCCLRSFNTTSNVTPGVFVRSRIRCASGRLV